MYASTLTACLSASLIAGVHLTYKNHCTAACTMSDHLIRPEPLSIPPNPISVVAVVNIYSAFYISS